MTLRELNAEDEAAVFDSLLKCCGSGNWAQAMLAHRPFPDLETLLACAESLWWNLQPNDWLEAFASHPQIGEKKPTTTWSSQEQNGMSSAADPVRQELAHKNAEYLQHFGWIFLINATGKSAEQMLTALTSRLTNDSGTELRVAAGEQAQITQLRLHKLLNE